MAKMFKKDIDLNLTLVEVRVILKGNKEINIYTTLAQTCDFTDWLNKNEAIFKSYKVKDKEQVKDMFFTFDDYVLKKSVSIRISDVKAYYVPFAIDTGDEYEFKILEFK